MNFAENILNEYKTNADKRVAFVCRLMIGFMILVALLNILNVFKIEPLPLYLTVGISIIDFFLPTLFYNILKIKSNKIRYVILFIMVFQSGLQYTILSYHTIIMLVFPLVLATLYNEKKYVIFTAVLSVPMIIISHLLALYLHIVPDEPLISLKGTIFYGIIPRIIEFFAIVVITFFVSDRIEKLVIKLFLINKELYEDQENLIFSFSNIIENKYKNMG